MQNLDNGIQVPTNGDPYNLTDDLATMGNSADVIITVVNAAVRDGIVNRRVGTTVRRLDMGGITEWWNGTSWQPEGARVDIGQGLSVPIFKAREVAVALNAFSVGQITFAEPFPNKLASVSLLRNHSTAGTLSFNIIGPNSGKASIEFVANGSASVASTTIYVYYQAWGY